MVAGQEWSQESELTKRIYRFIYIARLKAGLHVSLTYRESEHT